LQEKKIIFSFDYKELACLIGKQFKTQIINVSIIISFYLLILQTRNFNGSGNAPKMPTLFLNNFIKILII